VLAWLAGEQSKIDLWAKYDQTGAAEDEPYLRIGIDWLGFPPETARAAGKTADLAFGYSGGVNAYRKFGGHDTPEQDIVRMMRDWRNAHPNVVKFWNDLDAMAVRAVANPNKVFVVNKYIAFCSDGTFLRMRLPGGRKIAYPFPRIESGNYGRAKVHFMDNAGGKWTDVRRHGHGAWRGLWTENAVQAVARDLLVAAMQRLEAAGYPIVMHVHDEIVAEVPEHFGSEDEFLSILCAAPGWVKGLPVAAKVRSGPRFCKTEKKVDAQPIENTAEDDNHSSPDADAGDDGQVHVEPDQVHDDVDIDIETDEAAPRSWNNYASGEREWGEDITDYLYEDASGRPYHRVRRTSTKQFPQSHWDGGKWIKGAPPNGPEPYRLPQLLAAAPDEPVHITEGEKDANTLAALGLVATTNPGGAGKWSDRLNRWFEGRKLIYVHEDNDQFGFSHAQLVARNLAPLVGELRIVGYRDMPAKSEVTDWLDQGHNRAELFERCAAAEQVKAGLNVRNLADALRAGPPPPREWLLGNVFCREFLSSLIGDGGVGKTAVRYAQYLSLASNRSLTGEHVFLRARAGPILGGQREGIAAPDDRDLHAPRHHRGPG
jgi:hypothetical protein